VAPGALDAGVLGLRSGGDVTETFVRLAERAARTRRTLFLPPGRYGLSAAALRGPLQLAGVPGATILAAAASGKPILSVVGDTTELRGLTFEGLPGQAEPGSALVGCSGVPVVTIEDCRFTGGMAGGLRLIECGGAVRHCRFERIGGAALHALDSRGLVLAESVITECGDSGIQVWRTRPGDDGTRISGNRISNISARSGGSGQNGNAINVFRAAGVIVEGNHVRRVAYSAIRANSASNVQLLGNNAAGCGEVALYVEFGFEGAVVANNIVDRAAVGISVTNFDHGGRLAVVQGNLLRRLSHGTLPQGETGGGIGIHVEAETVVLGNTIEGADRAGLSLGWGEALKDVVASGNIIRDADHGIAVSVAPGAGKALIANNLIAAARRGAIAAKAWDRLIANDLTKDGAERFPNVTLAGNRIS
jgi:uncharacterized secreted repeat protein (TIGR03808 family)